MKHYNGLCYIKMIVGCWNCTFWQHLSSYQDGDRLVTGWTHGDFIVLLYWEMDKGTMTQYLNPWLYPDTELSSPCHILLMPSARLGSSHYQLFINRWCDSIGNRTPDLLRRKLRSSRLVNHQHHTLLIPGLVPTCDSAHSWRLIVLSHWPDTPLSHIILTPNQPVLVLS